MSLFETSLEARILRVFQEEPVPATVSICRVLGETSAEARSKVKEALEKLRKEGKVTVEVKEDEMLSRWRATSKL